MKPVGVPDDVMEILGRRAEPSDLDEPLPPEFSEDALAMRFSETHLQWRYTAAWGRWSHLCGSTWQIDSVLNVFDEVRTVCRSESGKCSNQRVAAKITSAATIAAVERIARSDKRHAAKVDQWDADPWLLNTPGGAVDLRTGILRPSSPLDYCTKSTAVVPSSEECPQWMAFLNRVTGGDQKLKEFMQRTCGYCLTGSTREHALFFLWGLGGNGKGVFLRTISGISCDYAKVAPIETFTASATERHPTELAALQGARLVTAQETEEGRRWSESKLKSLTGGDRISARYMRQDFFEYDPQFKLVIAGNHKPGLRTVDEAIRRRMNLLPFAVSIPAEERDPELAEKLKAEWPAILGWMIDGCLCWSAEGLQAPEAVRNATDHYLESEDALGRWIEESCCCEPGTWTTAAALFQSWKRWSERNNERVGSQKRFAQNLESRGFQPERTRTSRGFAGIGLREDL